MFLKDPEMEGEAEGRGNDDDEEDEEFETTAQALLRSLRVVPAFMDLLLEEASLLSPIEKKTLFLMCSSEDAISGLCMTLVLLQSEPEHFIFLHFLFDSSRVCSFLPFFICFLHFWLPAVVIFLISSCLVCCFNFCFCFSSGFFCFWISSSCCCCCTWCC